MVIEGHSIFNYSQSSDSFGLDIIIIIIIFFWPSIACDTRDKERPCCEDKPLIPIVTISDREIEAWLVFKVQFVAR